MQNNQAIPFNKENFKQILSMKFAWVIIVSIPGALIADFLIYSMVFGTYVNHFGCTAGWIKNCNA